MHLERECDGIIRFGSLPWEIGERLAAMTGSWLRYSTTENAIVVKSEVPSPCPAMTGVSCELISFMDIVPDEYRRAMPGGTLMIRDRAGAVLRLVVEKGEVRIQWPRPGYGEAIRGSMESLTHEFDPLAARVRGWARFRAAEGKKGAVEAFVGRVGGLFPEEELPSEGRPETAHLELKDSQLDPSRLVDEVLNLAEPGSVEADLTVRQADREARIEIRGGRVQVLRPTIGPQG